MDNYQTERKSINLSKEGSGSGNNGAVREAYPRYNNEGSNPQKQEYRNVSGGQTAAPYKEMSASGQYGNIPQVQPQNASNPPANYNTNDNLSHYYDYGNQPQVQPQVQPQPAVAPIQQNMKYCKYCGGRIPNDAVVCTLCGRQVEKLETVANGMPAPSVNNQINFNNQQIQGYQYNTSEKSKTAALILAAIGFFGLGGLHRLYVGKIVSGLIYLCTFGLFGLGTLIDVLQIASNTFKDGTGMVIRK